MSDVPKTCTCGELLREGASFCVACGQEVRQACPACGEERRWLATLQQDSPPWCDNRRALLYACESCGRWLLPGTHHCPNPECGARVLPTLPQHTGCRADGSGSTAGWNWPARRLAIAPNTQSPKVIAWASPDTLHAAFAAHGRWYVWAGTNLIALDSVSPLPPVGEGLGARANPAPTNGDGASWRSALGVTVRPAPGLPFEERVAIVGAGASLATERGYLLVGLHSRSEVTRLEGGTPLAQVASPFWWAGWSEENGAVRLRYAAIGETWDRLLPVLTVTLPEATLAPKGRIVMQDDRAYWPGTDGGVWQLDCPTGTITQSVAPGEELRQVWAEPDGPRIVRETQGRLLAGLGTPIGGRMPLEVPAGGGPLRGAFATSDYLVIVGERPIAFDPRTGERLHEANRPPGRWITGALAPSPDGEPRLLMLTQDGVMGRLSVLRVSSGIEDLWWMEPNFEPLALLPVGDTLMIAHSRGLLQLVENT